MSYLEKYNLKLDTKNSKPYITLADYGITFPSDSLACLNYAEYVHVYYDDENKVVAFQPCEKDEYAYTLCKKSSKQRFVRWSGHRHRNHIAKIINAELTKKGIRLDGKFLEDENILIFELEKYVKK